MRCGYGGVSRRCRHRTSCHHVGAWLSLVEHSVRDRGVASSNLAAPTTFRLLPCSQRQAGTFSRRLPRRLFCVHQSPGPSPRSSSDVRSDERCRAVYGPETTGGLLAKLVRRSNGEAVGETASPAALERNGDVDVVGPLMPAGIDIETPGTVWEGSGERRLVCHCRAPEAVRQVAQFGHSVVEHRS